MVYNPEHRRLLEADGAEKTRYNLMTGALPTDFRREAIEWMTELDRQEMHDRSLAEAERKAVDESRHREQLRLASSANLAAWIAAGAAILAVLVGVVTAWVTIHN